MAYAGDITINVSLNTKDFEKNLKSLSKSLENLKTDKIENLKDTILELKEISLTKITEDLKELSKIRIKDSPNMIKFGNELKYLADAFNYASNILEGKVSNTNMKEVYIRVLEIINIFNSVNFAKSEFATFAKNLKSVDAELTKETAVLKKIADSFSESIKKISDYAFSVSEMNFTDSLSGLKNVTKALNSLSGIKSQDAPVSMKALASGLNKVNSVVEKVDNGKIGNFTSYVRSLTEVFDKLAKSGIKESSEAIKDSGAAFNVMSKGLSKLAKIDYEKLDSTKIAKISRILGEMNKNLSATHTYVGYITHNIKLAYTYIREMRKDIGAMDKNVLKEVQKLLKIESVTEKIAQANKKNRAEIEKAKELEAQMSKESDKVASSLSQISNHFNTFINLYDFSNLSLAGMLSRIKEINKAIKEGKNDFTIDISFIHDYIEKLNVKLAQMRINAELALNQSGDSKKSKLLKILNDGIIKAADFGEALRSKVGSRVDALRTKFNNLGKSIKNSTDSTSGAGSGYGVNDAANTFNSQSLAIINTSNKLTTDLSANIRNIEFKAIDSVIKISGKVITGIASWSAAFLVFVKGVEKAFSKTKKLAFNTFNKISQLARKIGSGLSSLLWPAGIDLSLRGLTTTITNAINKMQEFQTSSLALNQVMAGSVKNFTSQNDALNQYNKRMESANQFLKEYTEDGLISYNNALVQYKNYIMQEGFTDEQVQDIMRISKDFSLINKNAEVSLEDALTSLSEGIKLDLSRKMDISGFSKNLSNIYSDYAKTSEAISQGITVKMIREDKELKAKAIYAYFKEMEKYGKGAASRLSYTFIGYLNKIKTQSTYTFSEMGKTLAFVFKPFIKYLYTALIGLEQLFIRINKRIDESVNKINESLKNTGSTLRISGIEDISKDAALSANSFSNNMSDVNDELDETANKAKKAFAPFDTINQLTFNNNGNNDELGLDINEEELKAVEAVEDTFENLETWFVLFKEKWSDWLSSAGIDLEPLKNAFETLKTTLGLNDLDVFGKNVNIILNDIIAPVLEHLAEITLPKVLKLVNEIAKFILENPATVATLLESIITVCDVLLELLIKFVEWFGKLTPEQQNLVVALAALTPLLAIIVPLLITAAPLLIKIVGTLFKLPGLIGKILKLLGLNGGLLGLFEGNGGLITGIQTGVSSIGTWITSSVIPWVTGTLGPALLSALPWLIGAVIAFFTFYKLGQLIAEQFFNNEEFREKIEGVYHTIESYVDWFFVQLKNIGLNVWDIITGIYDGISKIVKEWWENSFTKACLDYLVKLFKDVITFVNDYIASIIGFFVDGFKVIVEFFETILGTIADLFKGRIDNIKARWENLGETIKQFAINTWDRIKKLWEDITKIFKDWNPLKFFGDYVQKLLGWVGELWDKLRDSKVGQWIKDIFDGGDKINEINSNYTPTSSYAGMPTIKVGGLASGAVLPPNQPRLAIVGDQKRGTNIETQISTMMEAFERVMRNNNMNGGVINNVLKLDGQVVYSSNNRVQRQRGNKMINR